MRKTVLTALMMMTLAMPSGAVEFLGVDLCTDRMSTAVTLPHGSPLTIESVEVGDQGALLLILRSEESQILDQIDELMTDYTGNRGTGDETSLQWSGRKITAFAQVPKKKLALLAVSTSDDCRDETVEVPATAMVMPLTLAQQPKSVPEPVPAVDPPEPLPTRLEPVELSAPDSGVLQPGVAAVGVAVAAREAQSPAGSSAATEDLEKPDFELESDLRLAAFEDGWVDVMGVVVNNSGEAQDLATFDLSLYDGAGRLICVDTISVTILKIGQHRAFRDSIRCPGYSAESVVRTELQFAGGY